MRKTWGRQPTTITNHGITHYSRVTAASACWPYGGLLPDRHQTSCPSRPSFEATRVSLLSLRPDRSCGLPPAHDLQVRPRPIAVAMPAHGASPCTIHLSGKGACWSTTPSQRDLPWPAYPARLPTVSRTKATTRMRTRIGLSGPPRTGAVAFSWVCGTDASTDSIASLLARLMMS